MLCDYVHFLGFVPDANLPPLPGGGPRGHAKPKFRGIWSNCGRGPGGGHTRLVTPVGGLPEVVNELDHGLVFDGSQAKQIADGIVRALREPSTLPSSARCAEFATKLRLANRGRGGSRRLSTSHLGVGGSGGAGCALLLILIPKSKTALFVTHELNCSETASWRRESMQVNEIDKPAVIEVLNRILEAELAGVVRYTHYLLMVYGYGRIPIVHWLRGQAEESLDHAKGRRGVHHRAGRHPSLGIGKPWKARTRHRRDFAQFADP